MAWRVPGLIIFFAAPQYYDSRPMDQRFGKLSCGQASGPNRGRCRVFAHTWPTFRSTAAGLLALPGCAPRRNVAPASARALARRPWGELGGRERDEERGIRVRTVFKSLRPKLDTRRQLECYVGHLLILERKQDRDHTANDGIKQRLIGAFSVASETFHPLI